MCLKCLEYIKHCCCLGQQQLLFVHTFILDLNKKVAKLNEITSKIEVLAA